MAATAPRRRRAKGTPRLRTQSGQGLRRSEPARMRCGSRGTTCRAYSTRLTSADWPVLTNPPGSPWRSCAALKTGWVSCSHAPGHGKTGAATCSHAPRDPRESHAQRPPATSDERVQGMADMLDPGRCRPARGPIRMGRCRAAKGELSKCVPIDVAAYSDPFSLRAPPGYGRREPPACKVWQ